MAQGKGGAPGGHSQVNKLDNMLGSLQSDLNKLGVHTLAKGVCGACCKPIVGQVRKQPAGGGKSTHSVLMLCIALVLIQLIYFVKVEKKNNKVKMGGVFFPLVKDIG